MKIGIDCRFAGIPSGLGRYTSALVTHLIAKRDAQYVLFVQSEDEEWIQSLSGDFSIFPAPFPHYSFAEQLQFPQVIREANIDLLFSPHFNISFFCPVPFVVTVHDLILHRYPNQASFLKQCAYKILLQRAVRRAQKIIAVSTFTADEIANVYGKKIAEKTHVVSEGVDSIFEPKTEEVIASVLQKYDIQQPYFLYVGNAKEHKNVQMLIDAFVEANLQNTNLVLVTGGKEAKSLQLSESVKIIDGIESDADLAALYSGALSFVTASLYEGFCLPIAEARACGCKVIATNQTAIPALAKDWADLIDPSVENFADAFSRISDASKPEPLQLCSWEESAEEVAALLLDS